MEKLLSLFKVLWLSILMLFQAPVVLFTDNPPKNIVAPKATSPALAKKQKKAPSKPAKVVKKQGNRKK